MEVLQVGIYNFLLGMSNEDKQVRRVEKRNSTIQSVRLKFLRHY